MLGMTCMLLGECLGDHIGVRDDIQNFYFFDFNKE